MGEDKEHKCNMGTVGDAKRKQGREKRGPRKDECEQIIYKQQNGISIPLTLFSIHIETRRHL